MAATAATPPAEIDERRLEWLRLLAHPQRYQIVELLMGAKAPMRVTDVYQHLGLHQAVVSAHLINLKNRGVLESKASGTTRLYSVTNPTVIALVEALRPLLHQA